ncbi:RICIN domain-containing protein [Paenibacillus glycinis]|uniref:GH16 domain-containing protein n=1 Tax=Paenibacillus glycinis TaxID=2697035 RepID=A0ABW9XN82_9BACL|nr:RICIN domain-containing protein [Paenibacillus glycinis]NBD24021.1 hypothetical protein [Paenibacillus glycinis]
MTFSGKKAMAKMLLIALLLSVLPIAYGIADASPLPTGWTNADIGTTGLAGSSDYDASTGTFTVRGAGSDVWGKNDTFQFASAPLSGDGSIVAKVATMQYTQSWAKTGIMIRNDSSTGAVQFSIFSTMNGLLMVYRNTVGSDAQGVQVGGVFSPVWLKITRAGNVFTGFYSSNGTSWTQIGTPQTIAMGANTLKGLAVTSTDTSQLNTSTFTNVDGTTTTTPPTGTTYYKIPSRWLSTQYLYDGGTRVNYGTGSGDTYLWSLEDASGGYYRIKNKSSGEYMEISGGATQVATSNIASANTTSHWAVNVISGSFVSIKNRSNNGYLNVEDQFGYPTANRTTAPDNNNWWSEQWKLQYDSGPTPPAFYPQNMVSVSSPAYGANVSGNTTIDIVAPGLTTANAKSWLPGGTYGSDSTVATVTLDASGHGSFVFPANSYPHGPISVRITGTNGSVSDTSYLQLYNTGGVAWNEGMPSTAPAQASGMSLVFSDDFNTMPSISGNGSGATYAAHKPGGGDFGLIPFADPTGTGNPFSQVGTYLRIRADANKNTAGLISSLKLDGTGITAQAPAYFEARLIGPSAPGSWPAFWLMTKNTYQGLSVPADELDTIEAYGGGGAGNPNQDYGYWTSSHTWNYTSTVTGGIYQQQPMNTIGGGGGWAMTPHVYGTKITLTDTIYYLDGIEVGRHPTTDLSKTQPLFFMLNLAAGGNGWPMDLSRYNGTIDMFVDYVRVYKQ